MSCVAIAGKQRRMLFLRFGAVLAARPVMVYKRETRFAKYKEGGYMAWYGMLFCSLIYWQVLFNRISSVTKYTFFSPSKKGIALLQEPEFFVTWTKLLLRQCINLLINGYFIFLTLQLQGISYFFCHLFLMLSIFGHGIFMFVCFLLPNLVTPTRKYKPNITTFR
jgi:hypothetical protein